MNTKKIPFVLGNPYTSDYMKAPGSYAVLAVLPSLSACCFLVLETDSSLLSGRRN